MDRIDKMTPEEAIQSGEAIAKERGINRAFHGWALIRLLDIQQLNLNAEATPIEGKPWHADILLPEQAAKDDDLMSDFAAALARRSRWKARPNQ